MNSLNAAMDAACSSSVEARVQKLQTTMDSIEELHDKLIVELVNEDAKLQSAWFDEVEGEFYASLKGANAWLKDSDVIPIHSNKEETSVSSTLAQIVSLPKIELEPFSGDPHFIHS